MGAPAENPTQDVEMENVENANEEGETTKKDLNVLTIQEIREQVRQIEKAVVSKEPRYRGVRNFRCKIK